MERLFSIDEEPPVPLRLAQVALDSLPLAATALKQVMQDFFDLKGHTLLERVNKFDQLDPHQIDRMRDQLLSAVGYFLLKSASPDQRRDLDINDSESVHAFLRPFWETWAQGSSSQIEAWLRQSFKVTEDDFHALLEEHRRRFSDELHRASGPIFSEDLAPVHVGPVQARFFDSSPRKSLFPEVLPPVLPARFLADAGVFGNSSVFHSAVRRAQLPFEFHEAFDDFTMLRRLRPLFRSLSDFYRCFRSKDFTSLATIPNLPSVEFSYDDASSEVHHRVSLDAAPSPLHKRLDDFCLELFVRLLQASRQEPEGKLTLDGFLAFLDEVDAYMAGSHENHEFGFSPPVPEEISFVSLEEGLASLKQWVGERAPNSPLMVFLDQLDPMRAKLSIASYPEGLVYLVSLIHRVQHKHGPGIEASAYCRIRHIVAPRQGVPAVSAECFSNYNGQLIPEALLQISEVPGGTVAVQDQSHPVTERLVHWVQLRLGVLPLWNDFCDQYKLGEEGPRFFAYYVAYALKRWVPRAGDRSDNFFCDLTRCFSFDDYATVDPVAFNAGQPILPPENPPPDIGESVSLRPSLIEPRLPQDLYRSFLFNFDLAYEGSGRHRKSVLAGKRRGPAPRDFPIDSPYSSIGVSYPNLFDASPSAIQRLRDRAVSSSVSVARLLKEADWLAQISDDELEREVRLEWFRACVEDCLDVVSGRNSDPVKSALSRLQPLFSVDFKTFLQSNPSLFKRFSSAMGALFKQASELAAKKVRDYVSEDDLPKGSTSIFPSIFTDIARLYVLVRECGVPFSDLDLEPCFRAIRLLHAEAPPQAIFPMYCAGWIHLYELAHLLGRPVSDCLTLEGQQSLLRQATERMQGGYRKGKHAVFVDIYSLGQLVRQFHGQATVPRLSDEDEELHFKGCLDELFNRLPTRPLSWSTNFFAEQIDLMFALDLFERDPSLKANFEEVYVKRIQNEIDSFLNKILNYVEHPSRRPKFPGLRSLFKAYALGLALGIPLKRSMFAPLESNLESLISDNPAYALYFHRFRVLDLIDKLSHQSFSDEVSPSLPDDVGLDDFSRVLIREQESLTSYWNSLSRGTRRQLDFDLNYRALSLWITNLKPFIQPPENTSGVPQLAHLETAHFREQLETDLRLVVHFRLLQAGRIKEPEFEDVFKKFPHVVRRWWATHLDPSYLRMLGVHGVLADSNVVSDLLLEHLTSLGGTLSYEILSAAGVVDEVLSQIYGLDSFYSDHGQFRPFAQRVLERLPMLRERLHEHVQQEIHARYVQRRNVALSEARAHFMDRLTCAHKRP